MKNILCLTFLIFMLFMSFPIVYAEDVLKGKIIELAHENSIIQIKDHTFLVGMVLIQYNENDATLGSALDLQVGSIVSVYVSNRNTHPWRSEKIIIHQEASKAKVLAEMD